MADAVSVALVGAGYWGKKLLPKFLATKLARVRMVCDIHPGNRAEINKAFPDLSATASYEEVLKDPSIEAVVLATPPATHFPLGRKAIEAGKHIWIEKPLALNFDEGRLMVELARVQRTVLFVDHTFLYDPAIRMIRDLITKGELGDVYHAFLQRANLGRIKRDSNVWWNSAPHDVSIVLYLFPAQLTSIALHGYRYLQPELEDLNIAVMEMSDGASAFVYHNWLYPENTAKLTVVGSKKLLIYEGKFEKRAVTLYEYSVERVVGKDIRELPTTIPSKMLAEHKLAGVDTEEPLALAVSDFLGSVRDGRAPLSDGYFSLKVLGVLEAAEKSLRAGGEKIPVKL